MEVSRGSRLPRSPLRYRPGVELRRWMNACISASSAGGPACMSRRSASSEQGCVRARSALAACHRTTLILRYKKL